jgi:hypothetical protein
MDDPAALVAPRFPTRVTLAAAILTCCIALPISRDGETSLLRLLIEAWHEDWLSGTLLALVLGAPHGFALALMLATRNGGAWSIAAVKGWVTLMQFELVLLGLLVLHQIPRDHDMRAPWALVGFAAITAARFARRTASPRLVADDRDLRFYGRWGAILVVGIMVWGELQVLGRGTPGLWLHGTLAAAFMLASSLRRRC